MLLPLAASILWLAPISHNTNGLIGDWYGLVYYGALLLYGAFLFGSPALLAALNRQRFLSFAIGVAAYAALYVCLLRRRGPAGDPPTPVVRPTRSCRRSTRWPGCSPSSASPIAT